ncbi:hypothetical protein Bbelb_317820 [Branchiostoma belcheri]|nr:hypothetical protein Bbelb_317820 [Branchiostoma belcheri]
MALMKLRLGLLNEDLADRFGVSTTTCSCALTATLKVRASGMKRLIFKPSERERISLATCTPGWLVIKMLFVEHLTTRNALDVQVQMKRRRHLNHLAPTPAGYIVWKISSPSLRMDQHWTTLMHCQQSGSSYTLAPGHGDLTSGVVQTSD